MFFAIGLSAFSMMKIVIQAFYAMHDTRTPVMVAFFSLILNVVMNFAFFRALQNGGPALATSLSAFFDTLALIVIFRMRHGPFGVRTVLHSCVRFLAASAVMGTVIWAVINIEGFYAGAFFQRALALGFTIFVATGVYFGVAWLLRARELREIGEFLGLRYSR
jgi:putative peptidoglycan lipid II flippase